MLTHNRTTKYVRPKLTELNEEIDKSITKAR